jgi:hypothetical protein
VLSVYLNSCFSLSEKQIRSHTFDGQTKAANGLYQVIDILDKDVKAVLEARGNVRIKCDVRSPQLSSFYLFNAYSRLPPLPNYRHVQHRFDMAGSRRNALKKRELSWRAKLSAQTEMNFLSPNNPLRPMIQLTRRKQKGMTRNKTQSPPSTQRIRIFLVKSKS